MFRITKKATGYASGGLTLAPWPGGRAGRSRASEPGTAPVRDPGFNANTDPNTYRVFGPFLWN